MVTEARVGLQLPEGFSELPESAMVRVLDIAECRLGQLQEAERFEMKMAARGQWIAVGLSVLFGLISLWVTLADHDAVGGTIAGTTVVAISTAFIVGRRAT